MTVSYSDASEATESTLAVGDFGYIPNFAVSATGNTVWVIVHSQVETAALLLEAPVYQVDLPAYSVVTYLSDLRPGER